MHGLKNFSLSIVLSALLSVSAHAVDEDGTFTITIQGPEEEQIQQVAPRQTAPSRANVATNVQRRQPTRTVDATNNPNRQARTTPRGATTTQSNATTTTVAKTSNIPNFANDRRYEVKAGDTIWSVAHRYLPQDRSFNEFQIVASIYRHNPKAFANNNVNALQKTTLVIPDDKLMALESAQIGSALLSRGTLQMPALDYSSLTKTDTPKVETTTTVTTTTTTTTPTTTETKVAKKEETPKSEDETLPVYEATETKIKRLQEEEAKKELSQLTPNDDPNAQNENKNAKNKELIDLTKGSTAIDVKAINLMLDENKKMVESKLRVLENQLAEALERMKKSSAATAKTATDSVATLAGQYDNIIAKIQQDLIEIKGNINRLSQDNDRLREMLLANDEKIEDMQLQLSQFSITVPESSVDLNKPVMMILFGAGLLALVMIVLFIIFKAKYRSNQRVLTDDFDVDDGSYDSDDTSLLSDENGSVEIETPTGEEYEDETEPNKEEPKKEEAQDNKDNKENKEETAKTEESPVEADTSTPKEEEDSVQKAWDEAANTKAEEPKADKAVLDEWSQALDEQEQQENKQVDVSRDDESVADAWADALKEQNKAENNTEEAKSASSSLDDDMSAWTEAFKEQEESQDHELPPGEASVSTEQKDMADAWAKALEEQEKEAKEAQVSDAVETPVEDEKVKENSADIPEAQTTLEDQTSEPASDTQSTQEAEIAKAMANSSAPSVDVAEAEASKVESQETLDHDYLQEHDQDAVKVEDVNEDELLNQISGNVDEALKHADETEQIVESSENNASEPSKDEVVAEDNKDHTEALAEDDIANATLSGEEKALLDSLAKHQEQVAQDETVDAEFESDESAQQESENNQDSKSHKVDPKLGSKVDEVLNDDLDLEDILAQNDNTEVIDAEPEEVHESEDKNTDVTSANEDTVAIPQENEVEAEPQVEEAVIDEPVAVDEVSVEPKPNEKASIQNVTEDTVAAEPIATEIDANTDDLVQDNLDKSLNSDDKTSEQGVVSWAVPNDDYDVVQAHKEQAQAEDTTTQLQDDTGAEETVTEPSDTLDQNENEEEPSETIVEDEDVAANVNTEADTEVAKPQEEVVTTEPVETKVEEIKTEPQANADDTQAEALDTQTVDSEAVADVDTADESSADDLRELEIRLGASRADYDPGADQDLMNMLGGANEEPAIDEHHDLQGDVGSMLSDEIAKAASKSELETVDPQNEVLEQVFDKIGPISAIDPSEESDTITSEADTTLDNEQQNSKEYQYYVDELNLARLYFETGDTEEAIKIIDDVKENATEDLKEEAIKIMQSYGN